MARETPTKTAVMAFGVPLDDYETWLVANADRVSEANIESDHAARYVGAQVVKVVMALRKLGALDTPSVQAVGTIPADKQADVVNHPAHYTAGGIECIDAIAAATTGLEGIEAACTANAIKYLWRWKHKNGLEDLRKARWYINHLLGDN